MTQKDNQAIHDALEGKVNKSISVERTITNSNRHVPGSLTLRTEDGNETKITIVGGYLAIHVEGRVRPILV